MSGGIVGVATPDPGTAQLIQRLANPPNPLTQAGESVNALTAVQNYAAQRASADAYRQSVNPLTGEVDLGKYKALLSQGPGAFNFGPLVTSGGQAVGAVGQGTTADVQGKLAQLQATGQLMYPLLQQAATNGQVDPQAVLATLDQAHSMGLVTDQQYQQWKSTVSGMDAKQAASWVYGANMGNGEALRLLTGHVQPTATGTGTVFPQTSPGGAPSPAAPVPLGPGVDRVSLTVGTQTIENVPYNIAAQITQNPELLKTYYPEQYKLMHPGDTVTMSPPQGGGGGGGAPSVAPGHYNYPAPAPAPAAGGGGGGGGAPAVAPTGGGGGGPAAPAPAPAPATGGGGGGGGGAEKPQAATGPLYLRPPPPPPAEAGGVGMPPQAGYLETVQKPSQQAATELLNSAKDTPNLAGLINDMRAQVNRPGWNPGLGAQAGSTYRQLLNRIGINATGQSPDDQKMAQASYEELSKDANLIASRQLHNIGNPSDARQGLAEAITPGMAQSKEGILGISATLLGNQDAINRTNAAWQGAKAAGWSDGRYNEWLANNWNVTDPKTGGRFDPRVFWLADTEGTRADQDRRFVQKIPKDQQTQFVKNLQYAKNQGWVKQNDDGSFAVVGP